MGASPAYILNTEGERHSWQYVMPAGAPLGCSQPGYGLGEYKPLKGASNVVAVVGSAHVAGIVREWQIASSIEQLSQLLKAQEQAS